MGFQRAMPFGRGARGQRPLAQSPRKKVFPLNDYVTIQKPAEAEIIEKKSRFIASVKPVSSETEAQSFIQEITKKNYNARHNCFAYRIPGIDRYSDDGEPSGTAGMPMLDILRSKDIQNTAVVVTRYFGGILLGTGGLVRAYSKACQDGISAAGLVKMELYKILEITTDYTLSGKIQYAAVTQDHIIDNVSYTDKVIFTVLCKNGTQDNFVKQIQNLTAAKADVNIISEKYISQILAD